MKKTVFKVLSIIMALCVFLGAMPVMSFAEKEEKQFYYAEKIEKIDFSPNAEIKSSFNASANKFYSTGAQVDTAKYFYNQLTSNQKKLYDQLWSAHQNSYSGCSVDIICLASSSLSSKGQQMFSIKDHTVNILGFTSHWSLSQPLNFVTARQK